MELFMILSEIVAKISKSLASVTAKIPRNDADRWRCQKILSVSFRTFYALSRAYFVIAVMGFDPPAPFRC